MVGELFDLKRFTLHDGPGIRCTAFLKGCPLDCIWCHNPEGKRSEMEICTIQSLCNGCENCVHACPCHAIELDMGRVAINQDKCTHCGTCAVVCNTNAIITKGWEITAAALVEEFSKDEVFFKHSEGGVTLSGGDPMFQPLFTSEVLRLAKERGYHTAVETCLYVSSGVFNRMIDLPDLWIVDLKIWDAEEHFRLTGQTNQLIHQNYERLAQSGKQMITRIPVIPGCTDGKDNLVEMGRYISKVNPRSKVELIYYNTLAESKYRNNNLEYPLAGAPAYTMAEQQVFREMLAASGLEII